MSRSRFTAEEKEGIVQEYKRGEGSKEAIARRHGIDGATLRQWIAKYEVQGIDGLVERIRNRSYTKEFFG